MHTDLDDIPDFLLVNNRVPLTPEQRARLAAIRIEHPSIEEKWQRNRRLYDQEGERQKALKAELDRPRLMAMAAAKAAERAELNAVKVAARKVRRK